MIGEGPAARSIKLDLQPFTLVGATTRAGMLTNPLRDRFGIVARLEFYTADELDAYVASVKAERPEDADYVARRTLPDIDLCKERGFSVSLGEWRREIFGVAAPLYRTPNGDCLSVNCGIPSFRFSAEQVERECGPRILGLARSIRSLVEDEQRLSQ